MKNLFFTFFISLIFLYIENISAKVETNSVKSGHLAQKTSKVNKKDAPIIPKTKERTTQEFDKNNICPDKNISIFKPNIKNEKNSVLFGRISDNEIFINLKKINQPALKIDLNSNNKMIDMVNNKFIYPPIFNVQGPKNFIKNIINWSLIIYDKKMDVLEIIEKKGKLPQEIVWEKIRNTEKIIPDNSYFYSLTITTKSSQKFKTAPKPFIIRTVTAIRTRISADKLTSYETIFSEAKTQEFLKRLSTLIKNYPDEVIHIVGYVTSSNPSVCDNMYRLRNFLVGISDIPIERFFISCTYETESETDTKRISIIGSNPQKKIALIDYKPGKKHSLKVDDKKIDLDENNLFIFPKKDNNHVYKIEVNFASGNMLLIKNTLDSFKLVLNSGQNNFKNALIKLDHDFSPAIYCGLANKKRINWTASLGFGPYGVTSSYIPSLSQGTIFNMSLTRKNIRFLGSNNYVINISGFGIPGSFTATKIKDQTLYHLSAHIGYKIKTNKINIVPFAGYYYLTSKNIKSDNHSFIKSMYAGLLGVTFSLNKIFFNKITIDDSLKIKPVIIHGSESVGIENVLTLTYHFTRTYGTSFTWLKSTFNYTEDLTKKSIIENVDGYVFSLVYKF